MLVEGYGVPVAESGAEVGGQAPTAAGEVGADYAVVLAESSEEPSDFPRLAPWERAMTDP